MDEATDQAREIFRIESWTPYQVVFIALAIRCRNHRCCHLLNEIQLVLRREHGDRVVRVRSVGPLREDQGAAERAHDDGDDPPEHGLGEDLAVDSAGSFQEGHTGGSSDLRGRR